MPILEAMPLLRNLIIPWGLIFWRSDTLLEEVDEGVASGSNPKSSMIV